MTKIEKPGTANVGEFSPLNTPENTGESVTTAADQAMNHSKTPADSGPTGQMTATHSAAIKVVRK
jgi:hypothetical protein